MFLFRSAGPLVAALAVLALSAGSGAAQAAGEVSGRVVSTIASSTPEAVAGVTVRFPALGLERITDDGGGFSFERVPVGPQVLHVEVIGCQAGSRSLDVREGEETRIELVLERPAIEIPGLTVEGGARPLPEAPFAVERLEFDGREGRAERAIADLIRGAFPGARVVQGSGLPGGEISIQFRGPTSLSGGQQPLVVVDGAMTSGGLNDLNTRDIRSITVLKGAVASAHYGSRGQAGVIEIATRRGTEESPVRPGPLVLVDGVLSTAGLEGVDPDRIAEIEMLSGTAAVVLLGAWAGQTGIVRIRTLEGAGEAPGPELMSECAVPSS